MSLSLFVGNIPYGAMEKEIHEHFSTCGTVQNVRFIIDNKRGRFRGFGFVTMSASDAQKAIDRLDKSEFQGRRLIVSRAQSEGNSSLRSA